jgi:hypothetical protein
MRDEPVTGDAGRGRDAHGAARLAIVGCRGAQRALGGDRHRLDLGAEPLARRRERISLRLAHEELRAELLLERGDVAADRRVAQLELPARARKALRFRNGKENAVGVPPASERSLIVHR